MTHNDDISNYREVTATEKAAIEKSDAAWVRPPQAFIDMWNAKAEQFGGYNEETGFFELNELYDIPYAEALKIYADSFPTRTGKMAQNFYSHSYPRGRTLFSIKGYGASNSSCMYEYCYNLIHVRLRDGYDDREATLNNYGYMFAECLNLKRILGVMKVSTTANNVFASCKALEDVGIRHTGNQSISLDLSSSPMLSRKSLENIVEYKTAKAPTVVTIHSKAYDRLDDDLIAQAAEKQITFVTN